MDHHDLQAVCNMYQVPVHVLTVGVMGLAEPGARWTHLEPDIRLKSFSTAYVGLPDMWLFHTDNNHFDLIVRRDRVLAAEGTLKERQNKSEINHLEKEVIESRETVEEEELVDGPGYMGWKLNEEDPKI